MPALDLDPAIFAEPDPENGAVPGVSRSLRVGNALVVGLIILLVSWLFYTAMTHDDKTR